MDDFHEKLPMKAKSPMMVSMMEKNGGGSIRKNPKTHARWDGMGGWMVENLMKMPKLPG